MLWLQRNALPTQTQNKVACGTTTGLTGKKFQAFQNILQEFSRPYAPILFHTMSPSVEDISAQKQIYYDFILYRHTCVCVQLSSHICQKTTHGSTTPRSIQALSLHLFNISFHVATHSQNPSIERRHTAHFKFLRYQMGRSLSPNQPLLAQASHRGATQSKPPNRDLRPSRK